MTRHPSFQQGRDAFDKGILENPFARTIKGRYTTDSISSKEWAAGFNSRYFENLSKE